MDKYYVFLVVLAFPSICEALTFISSPDATTTACDGKNVTFNWNYTSGTTSTITWTKRNNDATNTRNATVATFSLGLFDPGAAYTSRVTQVGNNAAIQFSGVTPADDGIYQVEIFDGSSTLKGNTTLTTFDSPVGTITVSYLRITGVVKCDGLSYLGSGSLTLVLDGNIAMSTQSLSLEFTPIIRGRYCCCVNVSSDFDKCLPPGVNCSAECVDVEDITSTTSATPGSTTGKELYYLFILILIPVCIIICVVVVVVVKRRRKKKEKDSNSADLKDLARINSCQSTKSANDEPGPRL